MPIFRIIRGVRNIKRRIKIRKVRWLYLELDSELNERDDPPKSFIERRIIPPKKLSISKFKKLLDQFAELPRLEGIVIHLHYEPSNLARTQSLRQYLLDFRKKGKKVIFYAKSYSFLQYYLASVADEIVIQNGSTVGIIGLQMRRSFLKDALDRYGVTLDPVQISPYKSAPDRLTKNDFTKEARKNAEWILDSIYETIVEEIAESIGKTPDEFKNLIDNAPYTDTEALEIGLIHRIASLEELQKDLTNEGKSKKRLTPWWDAVKNLPLRPPRSKKNLIAVITVKGSIVDGYSKKPPIKIPIPLLGEEQSGDLTVTNLIRYATKNKNIKAVILHVNSGGGSGSASEAMLTAFGELVKKKPLVAYFNDVAASGGYYIATNANWVVAQKTTLTGSIGVFGGKFVYKEGLKKQGINMVFLKRGQKADLFSPERMWNEEERQLMFRYIKYFYQQFLNHVARFRKKSADELDPYCKGKVWTGKQALELGLIDQLGNMTDAIKKAAELAKLKEGKYEVIDLYKARPSAPEWISGNHFLDIEEYLKTFEKTHIWFLMLERYSFH